MGLGRFQTWDKWLQRSLTYEGKQWPPGSTFIPQFLPVTGPSWLVHPPPYPELVQLRGWAALLPDALPYIIQLFWLPGLIAYSGPPGWHVVPFSSLCSLLTRHSLVWSCPLCILPDVPASGTVNLLLYQTSEQSCSFPFLFLFFFHSCIT